MSLFLVFRCSISASDFHVAKTPGRHMRAGSMLSFNEKTFASSQDAISHIGRVDSVIFDSPSEGGEHSEEFAGYCHRHELARERQIAAVEAEILALQEKAARLEEIQRRDRDHVERVSQRGLQHSDSVLAMIERAPGRQERIENLRARESELAQNLQALITSH